MAKLLGCERSPVNHAQHLTWLFEEAKKWISNEPTAPQGMHLLFAEPPAHGTRATVGVCAGRLVVHKQLGFGLHCTLHTSPLFIPEKLAVFAAALLCIPSIRSHAQCGC